MSSARRIDDRIDDRRLAAAVLAPGFTGLTPPDWLCRALAEGLGAVVLFGHNIGPDDAAVAALTAELHALSPELLIASDEEGGDVTRVEVHRGSSLPGAAVLGALDDVALTEQVSVTQGRYLRSLGIDLDLAPTADVNTDPRNPVIGIRSFGTDPARVAAHHAAAVRGLQRGGVLACAKHFPGHGDTAVDSHLALPTLRLDQAVLEQRELVPFRAGVAAGVAAVMPGHLAVPAVDALPASLSPRWYQILREELGFTGFTVTDAVDMRAVADRWGVPGATVAALVAGADLVCLGNTREVDDAAMYRDTHAAVVAALADGTLDRGRLTEAAARLTAARALLAALHREPVLEIGAAAGDLATIGSEVADALLVREPVALLAAAPLLVDLRLGMNQAAGAVHGALPAAFREVWPDVQVSGDPAVQVPDGTPLVLVVGRGSDRDVVERVLADHPDAVLVRTDLPTAPGPAAATTVFTLGNNAAVSRALVRRLSAR